MHEKNGLNTSSAVLFADGSLESTVLAYTYASHVCQTGQPARLTLLVPPAEHILPKSSLACALQEQYPALALRSIENIAFPRFLFHSFTFQKNIAHVLRLVEVADHYGETLLAPVYQERYIPGIPSPSEAIQAINHWFQHLTLHPLHIATPFYNQTLKAIVYSGIELGVDLSETFDCEEPVGQKHCCLCQRCIERYDAIGSKRLLRA